MSSAVRTLVTFQSNKFNATKVQEYFINPGCFGDDLCRWLIEQLTAHGVQCDQSPEQEDFGWYFNFWIDKIKHCLVCGFRPDDENDPGIWIAWIERSTGLIGGLFGHHEKISAAAPGQIHKILSTSPEISNVRWHLKIDFDRGDENAAQNTP